MKGTPMMSHRAVLLLAVAGFFLVHAVAALPQENRFKLKPGAAGKVCLTCHDAFEQKLKSAFVHTPVKQGECAACHNPHASSFEKMLASPPSRVCSRCHPSVVPAGAVSAHKVVIEGGCLKCHDAHGAPNKFNLLKKGNELCIDCHKALLEAVGKVAFKHDPVEESCLNCHNPHASTKSASLLIDKVPALCVNCHETGGEAFSKAHMGYPVASARCTSCHDPHGSERGGLLYATSHKPVADKLCRQCHEAPDSATPFRTRKSGYELCRGCHSDLVNEMLSKGRLHWPVLGKDGCGTCHNPHASKEKGLLRQSTLTLCGRCHADTLERQEKSLTKHVPVQEGKCMACHVPHASDNNFLLKNADTKEVCGTCHEWQKHSTHPIGDKVVDPRNKNLTVQCVSCHRSHGTEFKHMLQFGTVSEMCTQCHTQYQR